MWFKKVGLARGSRRLSFRPHSAVTTTGANTQGDSSHQRRSLPTRVFHRWLSATTGAASSLGADAPLPDGGGSAWSSTNSAQRKVTGPSNGSHTSYQSGRQCLQ